MYTRVLFLLISTLACAAIQAEVYRWIDPNGHVQFGDRPPPTARQIEAMDIDLEQRINPAVDPGLRIQRQQRLAEELERDRHEREQARLEARRAAQLAASLCTQYTDRVRLLADENVRWIKGRNANGSNFYYSDAEVAGLRAEAIRGMNYYCR
ncbi:MAG: DUF4124 domain-containing protein [Gammaproteobacteria bacterium]|nr:DUF4124 domain-containing protein [Gammaproteobacteria bacterium]MCP5136260.1 DUF4124 domain-containing protein [Gammaproteobacteria bacterium]